MRRVVQRNVVALLVLLFAAACSEAPTAAPEIEAEPQLSSHTTTCDLVSGLSTDVRNYFPQPERRAAQDVMKQLDSACKSGVQADVTLYASELLRMIESLLNAARGGDPVIGSRLGNGLLRCTRSLCSSAPLPQPLPGDALIAAMSPQGTFAFRAGPDALPAVARDAVPFANGTNSALWGVELSAGYTWAQVSAADPVLIYGFPVANLAVSEVGIGALQYDFRRWPRNGTFVNDNVVHVGVCLEHEVALPHDAQGRSLQARMQREQTLLSSADRPGFCPPEPQEMQLASLFGGVALVARAVLPSTWFASALDDTSVRHVGGSALDFSRFAPVGANTAGYLEMVQGPVAVATAGESIGTIKVRAWSGGDTRMERVRVTLSVENNSGEPAGALLQGTTVQFTDEQDGMAVFEGTSIPKPGGYIICATGELAGFTFERVCSSLFHVR
jgi:hypothetical protein